MDGASIKIPAELFALAESSHFEGVYDLPKLEVGPDVYRFQGPIEWDVSVTNTGEAFLLAGHARAKATTQCARCLDDVDVDFAGDIEGYYLINNEVDHPEDLDDDEFDVLPDDHIIDLASHIVAALLVEAPAVPLCKDDCLGICPQCGANLNEGPCGCDTLDDKFADDANPFAVLKNLQFDDERQNDDSPSS